MFALTACGSTGSSSSGDDDMPPGSDVDGCDGSKLLANPNDAAARGPWAVGAKTLTLGGLTVEVWYPAPPGSDAGKDTARYDIRQALPPSEAAKIPDAENPWQSCDCVRDLPFDGEHGPYPAIVFVHGTAAFRHQSLPLVTHWASRGFVVIAANHPGLYLGDFLGMACGGQPPPQNLSGDIDSLIAALKAPAGDLAFLAGHVDAAQLAVIGHSAGGGAAAAASTKPGVRVVIPLAAAQAATAAPMLASVLYMGGTADNIVSWNQVMTAWSGAPTPRRLVGIAAGGHLTFSDLCETKNAAGQDLLQIAQAHQVCGAQYAGFLFDCDPSHIEGRKGWDIINYASSSVLESTLQCHTTRNLNDIKSVYPDVADYREAL
jgi:predicted dienelactone hydrolase